MASIGTERTGGKTRYSVRFQDADGRRRKIRLRGVNKKAAEHIRVMVDALVAAQVSGRPLDNATAQWIAGLGQELADKLAGVGLIEARTTATLGELIDEFIGRRTDARPSTVRNWRNTQGKLIDYFEADRDLRTITAGEFDDWFQAISKTRAVATVSKAVKHAKQFMGYAVKKRYLITNPAQGLKVGSQANPDRIYYVPRETIAKVLDACPDAQWRLIVALARYGGLRVPSELLAITWADVDWDRRRLTIPHAKTKRRVLPIFPEMQPPLEAVFDAAEPGTVHVITRYRNANSNLRTQFMRILRQAGVEPWPRIFHNLRATRQTELANKHPAHVVCSWLGNTPRVAYAHYLSVTDEHFEMALKSGPTCGPLSDKNAASGVDRQVDRQQSANNGNEQKPLQNPVNTDVPLPLVTTTCHSLQVNEHPRQDSNR